MVDISSTCEDQSLKSLNGAALDHVPTCLRRDYGMAGKSA
jgi:hypothetical protein